MADGNLGVIYYEVEAKTAALIKAEREASDSLKKLTGGMKSADSAAKSTDFAMKKTSAAIKQLGQDTSNAKDSMFNLANAMKALLTARAVSEVRQMADAWTGLQNRLRLVTDTQQELNQALDDVFNIAQGSSQELDVIAQVYQRFAQNAETLGLSLSEVADVTDTVAKAVAISGASAASAEAALVQFGQALASGVLRGEELNSVMEQTPALAKAIADGMGITVGELRKVAAEGKITSDVLITSLNNAAGSVSKQFETRVKTIEQAFTELGNSVTRFVGEKDEAIGASAAISKAIGEVSKHVDTLATVLAATGSAALARYVTMLGASVVTTVKASVASREKAVANMQEVSATVAAANADAAKTAASLAAAESDVVAATAALNKARANASLTSSSAALVAAEKNLQIAEQNLTRQRELNIAATKNQTAANHALAASKSAVASVGSRLLGILGGPVGLGAMILSAGAAIATMSRNANEAKPKIDFLALSIRDLADETLALTKVELVRYIKEMGGLDTEASKAAARIETLNARIREAPASPNVRAWQEEIKRLSAEVDIAQSKMKPYQEMLDQINKLEEERANRSNKPEAKRDPEADKRLAALRQELELAKLIGEARARQAAIYSLGDNATEEQKKEAEELAAQIYRLEEARKKAAEAGKSAFKESEQAAKENRKAISDLDQELRHAALSGRALAEAQALSRLNSFASQEDIDRVKALAGALYELELAEENRQLLAGADPVEAERQRFEEQLGNLRRLNEAKLLEDQRYYELKEGLEREHIERMRLAEEERFAAQNWQNELLIKSLNSLEQASASALTGLISGANNSTQAIQQLAAGISQELIGSLVKMGMEQVKAWAMGKVAQSAAAAGYATSVQGQVAANTALAAQAAFASTAAIPITGPAMAPAAAAAAASAAGSLGAPAIAASALTMAGARFYGGPVEGGGKMYRVNEGGAPEILNTADGKQYLLPNSRGQVVSNRDATGGTQVNVSVVINSDGSMSAGADSAAWAERGREMGESVRAIVKDELYKANSAGGMLRANHYG